MVLVLCLLIAYRVQVNKNTELMIENSRLAINNRQLQDGSLQVTTLLIKEKEVTGHLKRERDSLAAALEIKPKQITSIVYINNRITDTVKVTVPVIIAGINEWKILDSGDCFKWSANAFLKGDSLRIERTSYEGFNITTETFYRKRRYKFLFIPYGKYQNFQAVSSDCGISSIKTFNFTK